MKLGPNSRQKGKRGELEIAKLLRELGYDARRGQQFKGGGDSPDVVCAELSDMFHFEVKRVERGSLYDWLAQAKTDAGDKVPVVLHRRSRGEWVAILPARDFFVLEQVKKWL